MSYYRHVPILGSKKIALTKTAQFTKLHCDITFQDPTAWGSVVVKALRY
jgi:hypothetical protein